MLEFHVELVTKNTSCKPLINWEKNAIKLSGERHSRTW